MKEDTSLANADSNLELVTNFMGVDVLHVSLAYEEGSGDRLRVQFWSGADCVDGKCACWCGGWGLLLAIAHSCRVSLTSLPAAEPMCHGKCPEHCLALPPAANTASLQDCSARVRKQRCVACPNL